MSQIAPNPIYPERFRRGSYERLMATNPPGMKGPLRHEEGIATDTDVPNDFLRGAYGDTAALPGTINRVDPQSYHKDAAEVMHERAHVGSAAWVEAPTVLSDFVQGAGVGQKPPSYERVTNPMTVGQARRSQAVVYD